MSPLDSPSVLITGASGGIGRVLAARLQERAWRVAVVGRELARLEAVPAELRIVADVTTPEGAAQALQACRAAWGQAPQHLAHAVGSTLIAPLHRTRPEALQTVLQVNLLSALYTLQAWLQAREGQGPGAAVFDASFNAKSTLSF